MSKRSHPESPPSSKTPTGTVFDAEVGDPVPTASRHRNRLSRLGMRAVPAIWSAAPARFASVMAVPPTIWDQVLVGTPAGHQIVFDGVAVVASSTAVGMATTVTAFGLLDYPLLGAVILGLAAGGGLYMIDHHMLVLRRQQAADSRSFRTLIATVRLAVLLLMVFLGLCSATNAHRETIDAKLAEERKALESALGEDARYKPQLDTARTAVTTAGLALQRQQELQKEIQTHSINRTKAEQESIDQCEGNTSLDGQTRIQICGPKARGAKTAAASLGKQVESLQKELDSLENPKEAYRNASAELERIAGKIKHEAEKSTGGFAARLRILGQLVMHDVAAAFAVVPWLMLGLIPESLLWISYTRAVHPGLRRLSNIENEILSARSDVYRCLARDSAGGKMEPIVVHVPAKRQKSSFQVVKGGHEGGAHGAQN